VRVYEARHDHTAIGIEARFMRVGGAQFISFSNSNDFFIADKRVSSPPAIYLKK